MQPDERRTRFEELVPRIVEDLRRYLARRTDAATAEDALAETLLVCWRRVDDLPADPLPFAYGVARRCLANAERGRRRQRRLATRIAVVDPPPESGPPHDDGPDPDVAQALGRLRPADAELLRLWAWEDLSAAEIAVSLGISSNAASIRLHRARAKFKVEIGKLRQAAGHQPRREGDRP